MWKVKTTFARSIHGREPLYRRVENRIFSIEHNRANGFLINQIFRIRADCSVDCTICHIASAQVAQVVVGWWICAQKSCTLAHEALQQIFDQVQRRWTIQLELNRIANNRFNPLRLQVFWSIQFRKVFFFYSFCFSFVFIESNRYECRPTYVQWCQFGLL